MARNLEFELSVAHAGLREVGMDHVIEELQIRTLYNPNTLAFETDIFCRFAAPGDRPDNEDEALCNALVLAHQIHDRTAHMIKCVKHPELKNLNCDFCGLDGTVCEGDLYEYTEVDY